MPLPYRSAFDAPTIRRAGTPPEDPQAIVGRRPRGSRRPHTDATVATVRSLIERTTLTYAQIEKKTGVGRASICRWTRDQGWVRPVFAPRATDTVPRPRASAQLRRRLLAGRLQALAERYVRALEETPGVDLDKLAAALELIKMAKLAAMTRRRRRMRRDDTSSPALPASLSSVVPAPQRDARLASDAGPQGPQAQAHEQGALDSRLRGNERGEAVPTDPIAELRAAGIDPVRVPHAALEDFIASRAEPEDFPELRPRGRRSRRNRAHAKMLGK